MMGLRRRRKAVSDYAKRQRAFETNPNDARLDDLSERLSAVEAMIAVMPDRINEDLLDRAARAEGGEREARRVLDAFIAAPEEDA